MNPITVLEKNVVLIFNAANIIALPYSREQEHAFLLKVPLAWTGPRLNFVNKQTINAFGCSFPQFTLRSKILSN